MIYFHNLNAEYFKNYTKDYIVEEDKSGYIIKYLMPEVKKEEIDISLKGKYLHIKDTSSKKRIFVEKIDDKILLNKRIDKEKVNAKLEDGILKIKLGFKKGIEETKKILID